MAWHMQHVIMLNITTAFSDTSLSMRSSGSPMPMVVLLVGIYEDNLTQTSLATALAPQSNSASSPTMTSSSTSPTFRFTSYNSDANNHKLSFSTYSDETNSGAQAFVSYGKNGNGGPSEFNNYAENSNTIHDYSWKEQNQKPIMLCRHMHATIIKLEEQ
ncbi:hypothetical protein FH972_027363 [Carpinus fangiana]|uniref:BURP domain-containing protein n=1 Tax=Carpinus fangiana TaxID=176857 RepID=A0A5N6Q7F6_9ROSI|nr:hypothetical protein FH972_027363 [Carpinus fangiana]